MAALAGLATELLPLNSFGANEPSVPMEFSDPDIWPEVKRQFRIRKDLVYLNNAGLGASPNPVLDEVIDKTAKLETAGSTGHNMLEGLRKSVAKFLSADPKEICFVRNATEGMNIVANEVELCRGDEILMTTHEHVGGSMPWVNVANKRKAKIRLVDLDLSGEKNFDLITAQITKKTKVLVLSHVTCTTGMVLPVKKLAEFCREKGLKICVDGAQSVGLIDVNLSDLKPDYYTCSGHKWLFGPKGTGILFIAQQHLETQRPARSDDLLDGGHHGHRAVPGFVVAMGDAADVTGGLPLGRPIQIDHESQRRGAHRGAIARRALTRRARDRPMRAQGEVSQRAEGAGAQA